MFFIDMHVHTSLGGDSLINPEEIPELAGRAGLNAVCVTEHHSYDLSRPLDAVSRDKGFFIFRGLEYRAAEGHLLVYGVPAGRGDLMPGLPMQTAVDWVYQRGGVAIPAHPFQKGIVGCALGNGVSDLTKLVAIETLNGSIPETENQMARQAAEQMGIPGIGGSDAHGPGVVGCAYTVFPEPVHSMEELVAALKKGGYYPEQRLAKEPLAQPRY